nr:MAG TPA: antigen peptide transporter [Caudoviricetes sp.]
MSYQRSRPAPRGCDCRNGLSFPWSVLPRLRGALGSGQNAGRHPVNDGRFGSFTVSLIKIHFVFPFLLCIFMSYVPDFTMRRWKTKHGYFLSNGAEFFCAIFC